ncbi:MAG TPA: hypothetical protein DCG19_14855 [Cryomorphaceae bacterium]|nr:hypothetical protein [Owenweeksia sp.]MBF97409.1 hypothetical protein [Owenweeksia sp.]HAD98689.1 hypothetical protein [Cryomorphaceae bacterium]HBF20922.1 hypothetical protein [Cryomorphaceae bacterium]HCQ17020.1 hypothetical protein [Cryomorphaceae bacterium]|tara:strand:- start:556 stop:1605 length:1050 start_codon:yes stop_codon:yes gene_type:complete
MTYKIYIVEDNPKTFNAYKEKIQSLNERNDLTFSIDLVSTKPTSSFTVLNFEQDLEKAQPDIIFLDYELEWLVKSEHHEDNRIAGTALDVIKMLFRKLNRVNFPPIVVLNTRNAGSTKKIYKVLNSSEVRGEFPQSFLKVLTPDVIMDEPNEVVETLRESVDQLIHEREVANLWENRSDFTFYTYPKGIDLEDGINKENFFKDKKNQNIWRNARKKLSTPPLLSRQNFLFATYQTDFGLNGKERLGSLFTINSEDQTEAVLFRFDSAENIRTIISEGLDIPVGKFANILYNPSYMLKKITSRIAFKKSTEVIETSFKRFLKQEERDYDRSVKDYHPILRSFYKNISGIS